MAALWRPASSGDVLLIQSPATRTGREKPERARRTSRPRVDRWLGGGVDRGRRRLRELGTSLLQGRRQGFARTRIVVHHQHADPVENRVTRSLRLGRNHRRVHAGLQWEGHGERGPLPGARTHRLDRPAMRVNQLADDREPEAEAAMAPRAGAVPLAERFEDVRQQRWRDSLARVAHDEAQGVVGAFELHLYSPAGWRELDRIRDQVP